RRAPAPCGPSGPAARGAPRAASGGPARAGDGEPPLGDRPAGGLQPRPDPREAAAPGDAELPGRGGGLHGRARRAALAGRAGGAPPARPRRGAAPARGGRPQRERGAPERPALRAAGVRPARPAVSRIAFVSPLPPAPTGIADYAADVLALLAPGHAIDAFHDQAEVDTARLPASVGVHRASALVERHSHQAYDAVVYQMGNGPAHDFLYDLIPRRPGLLVLHDLVLHHARARMFLDSPA